MLKTISIVSTVFVIIVYLVIKTIYDYYLHKDYSKKEDSQLKEELKERLVKDSSLKLWIKILIETEEWEECDRQNAILILSGKFD